MCLGFFPQTLDNNSKPLYSANFGTKNLQHYSGGSLKTFRTNIEVCNIQDFNLYPFSFSYLQEFNYVVYIHSLETSFLQSDTTEHVNIQNQIYGFHFHVNLKHSFFYLEYGTISGPGANSKTSCEYFLMLRETVFSKSFVFSNKIHQYIYITIPTLTSGCPFTIPHQFLHSYHKMSQMKLLGMFRE